MRFRITRHASASPPQDALDLFSERMDRRREDVCFSRAGTEVRANLDRDDPVGRTRDERTDIGRRAVLEAVGDICERVPELEFDWYAVSPAR